MEAGEAVRRAAEVLAANTECDIFGVIAALEWDGFPADTAMDVAAFLPLAAGRAFLEGAGPRFPDFYIRVDDEGRERSRRPLLDEPLYRAALALVPVVAAQGEAALMAVLVHSAEFQAINEALHAGSQPEELLAAPPALPWAEGMPETAAPPPAPWWRFGRQQR